MAVNSLFVEKYRPNTLDLYVADGELKTFIQGCIETNYIPHLLLHGIQGTGKTTLAKMLANTLDCDYIYINASDERNIDTVRDKIVSFASTNSFSPLKIVILDEADYLQANSTQPALRNYMEEFSANCRFIFTCNYKNKIIEPLHSRCAVVEFKIENKDKQALAAQFFKRATQILKQENIEFDPKVVAELVTKHFPDWRRVLNELQRYSVSGKIDTGIFVNMTHDSFKELVTNLKERNFTEVRKWVAKNSDADTTALFREFYDNANEYVEAGTIPNLILILAEYQYKAAFVADHELNIMAAMTEVMVQCKFK